MKFTPLDTTAYRLIPAGADPLSNAPSVEDRFHHDGQSAIYTSLSPEGCGVAIRRYVGPDDAPREIAQIKVTAQRILDLRDSNLPGDLGVDPSMVWQDIRATGRRSPTWKLSDTTRTAGAQGMLYASRSQPHLTHLVLFGLNGRKEAKGTVRNRVIWSDPDPAENRTSET